MIWLEGNVGVGDDNAGNKVLAIEVGPGVQYGIRFVPDVAANIGNQLAGKSVVIAPAGSIPTHPQG